METLFSPEPVKLAKKADLRYVSERSEGYLRQGDGDNFKYYDQEGRQIRDQKILKRVQSLVIPPAWEQVWICPQDNGHIQACGVDSKGRKQYLYHADWTEISKEAKFDRLVPFGRVLPRIRRQVKRDLEVRGLPRTKVLAAAVWLLENTLIRVGNDEYAKDNLHYGLTTLRKKHVDFDGGDVYFEFVGKSGIEHTLQVSDQRVVGIIRRCVEIPGYELFRYVIKDEGAQRIDSGDVNDYLQQVSGMDVTARTFRTWGGTLGAAQLLAGLQFEDEKQAIKNVKTTVKEVAKQLGNTPKICRDSYIHPAIVRTYQEGVLIPHFEQRRGEKPMRGLTWYEGTMIDLLNKYS